MEVTVVQGTAPQLLSSMLFPEQSQATVQWLHNQFHRDTSILTDAGRQFSHAAEEWYRRYNDPRIDRTARRIMRAVKGLGTANQIAPLETVSEIQAAKPLMQRYIMALPEIRKRYHRQLCDGYSESYVDGQPGVVGDQHYDYRRVMDGVVQDAPAGKEDEYEWFARYYADELYEGDRELDAQEKFIVLSVWDLAKEALKNGIDPTDIFNRKLDV